MKNQEQRARDNYLAYLERGGLNIELRLKLAWHGSVPVRARHPLAGQFRCPPVPGLKALPPRPVTVWRHTAGRVVGRYGKNYLVDFGKPILFVVSPDQVEIIEEETNGR